ncbi:MAG: protease complex subunit PrcB family protein [Roseburia sp.]|nr:protease complex subunit PrcB family protein [Roseburia sp.]
MIVDCQKIVCSLLTACSLLTVCSFFAGCSVKEGNDTKVSDLEYTIVEEADIPEELRTMIEEKKAADFKMSQETGGELYIVRGYGEQDTGGYSIGIQSFYVTVNAIVFDTELIGPRKGETVSKSPSYPYIVIKLPFREENIIFE